MNIVKAVKRDTTKKSIGKDLKKSGFALAALYGGKDNKALYVNLKEFQKVFSNTGKQEIITLEIENEGTKEVLVKAYQIDGIKRTITHIDFYEIDRSKKIKTSVPLRLTGVPEGVRLGGGVLEQIEHDFTIRAFPGSIPKEIIVDVTDLQVGRSMHISDINFPEGVEPMGDISKAIVTVVAIETEEEKSTEEAE